MGVKVRKKDGKWYVFINHHGTRKAICVGDSKRAAEDVKRKLEAQLILGNLGILDPAPPTLTFATYAAQWLATHAAITCKPSTYRILAGIVRNHLLPAFGTQDLRSLTRSHVRAFIADKAPGYSPAYLRNLLRTLQAICAHAVDEELLISNPAAHLGRSLPTPQPTPGQQPHAFTSAELARYLEAMHTHYPQHYAYFLCLARTGMREGEALGLHWEDVQCGQSDDDPHRFLHVQRTYDAAHHLFNTPKNGHSRRVDMSQELRGALLVYRQQCQEQALRHGRSSLPSVVFCGRHDRPLAPSGLYMIHRRACRLAGLRETRVHDLRHTYATIQLYEHLAPMQYVSEQLGHRSIKMTIDTYGHPRQGTNIALADQLDQQMKKTAGLASGAVKRA